MTDYSYYLDIARESCPERDELPETPFEAAMQYMDEASRSHWANWAVRRNVAKYDPMWSIIEMMDELNRAVQESIAELHQLKESTSQEVDAETNLQRERLRHEGLAIQRKGQDMFERSLDQIVQSLPQTVQQTAARQVSQEIQSIWKAKFSQLIALVVVVLLLIGGAGLGTGYAISVSRTEREHQLLTLGNQVSQRFHQLNADQQAEFSSLMDWDQGK